MTMTDPIADMLTRLRNANSAYHDSVTHAALEDQGAHRRDPQAGGLHRRLDGRGRREVGKTLVVDLKYGPNRERCIAGVRRVSKPGLRVYAKATTCREVLGGLGVAIISTSPGLLTDQQASKQGWAGKSSPTSGKGGS